MIPERNYIFPQIPLRPGVRKAVDSLSRSETPSPSTIDIQWLWYLRVCIIETIIMPYGATYEPVGTVAFARRILMASFRQSKNMNFRMHDSTVFAMYLSLQKYQV